MLPFVSGDDREFGVKSTKACRSAWQSQRIGTWRTVIRERCVTGNADSRVERCRLVSWKRGTFPLNHEPGDEGDVRNSRKREPPSSRIALRVIERSCVIFHSFTGVPPCNNRDCFQKGIIARVLSVSRAAFFTTAKLKWRSILIHVRMGTSGNSTPEQKKNPGMPRGPTRHSEGWTELNGECNKNLQLDSNQLPTLDTRRFGESREHVLLVHLPSD